MRLCVSERPKPRAKHAILLFLNAVASQATLWTYKRYEYPPSDATIARNKELYAIAHPEDVAVKEPSAHAK